jgi:hypothetical protein
LLPTSTNPSSFPVQSGGSIGPNSNNAYDLGSASLQWRNIYAAGSICFAGGTDCTSSFSTLGVNYWNLTSGTVQPKNATVDLLIGGTATTSAKFGFINVNSGTPTATISGNNRILHTLRQNELLIENTVDTIPDAHAIFLRFDMDI